jgi:hypothetical protein
MRVAHSSATRPGAAGMFSMEAATKGGPPEVKLKARGRASPNKAGKPALGFRSNYFAQETDEFAAWLGLPPFSRSLIKTKPLKNKRGASAHRRHAAF